MKQKLQAKYDPLFTEGWRPPLQSRNDLISWACHQQNSFFKDKGASDETLTNCENPRTLIEKYGPDYESVKAKLGYIRGLYRNDI